MKPLQPSTVQETLTRVKTTQGVLCQELKDRFGLSLRAAASFSSSSSSAMNNNNHNDWTSSFFLANDASLSTLKTPWFFGFVLCKDNEDGTNDDEDDNNNGTTTKGAKAIGLVSFYVAYSTWNGRIMYLDQIVVFSKDNNDSTTTSSTTYKNLDQFILRLLASIAVELDFSRVTWRHKDSPDWHLEGSNRPEMHGEVLTLSMDQEAMKKYVDPTGDDASFVEKQQQKQQAEAPRSFSNATTSIITDCLDYVNQSINNNNNNNNNSRDSNQNGDNFQLRLAQKEDLDTIGRLVQGLADYVKEPDAVHIGVEDYRLDGFSGENPLFCCLLLDYIDKNNGTVHTCGYAFCFFGYLLGSGRFMYLEDLFLEVEYRQQGGGNLLMKTLARICLRMQCEQLIWQALDWNTAGLSFYSKIGATILEGEKTSRYCGDAMKQFATQGAA